MGTDGHFPELSIRQERALAALLTAPSVKEAARRSFVSYRTLRRWLQGEGEHERAFQEALRRTRAEATDHAKARLQEATGDAVTALLAVLSDPMAPASAKVSAAGAILTHAARADTRSRLVALGPLPDPATLTDEELEALMDEG